MSAEAGKFICEVVLPETSPVRSAIGLTYPRKSMAKRSAAFEACVLLRKGKYLNEHLLPIYAKQLPAMRNALLAVNLKKTNMYPMRIKPELWSNDRGIFPDELFMTVLDVPEGLDRPHQPLALLTRTRLPQFPQFGLHLNSGKMTHVASTSLGLSIKVTRYMTELISAFTLRVFKDLFNKTFEQNPANMSYWIAPLRAERIGSPMYSSQPMELIDHDVLQIVHTKEEHKWTPSMSNDLLSDVFLVDKWNGARRFFSIGVADGVKPLDPVPEWAPPYRWDDNVLDYTVSLYKKARANSNWDTKQIVLLAEKILLRRNMLAAVEASEKEERNKCYLCPEPLVISVVSFPASKVFHTKPTSYQLPSWRCVTCSQPSSTASNRTSLLWRRASSLTLIFIRQLPWKLSPKTRITPRSTMRRQSTSVGEWGTTTSALNS